MIELFQINEKEYFYQAIRVLFGFIILHFWRSKEGKFSALALLYKFIAIMVMAKNKKRQSNEASSVDIVIRIWRLEFRFAIGWHDDPWGMII